MENVLLNYKNWNTPHESIPFEEIKLEHIEPAFEEGLKRSRAKYEAIKNNLDEPTFENVIEQMMVGDRLLYYSIAVLWNLTYVNSSPEVEMLKNKLSKKLKKFSVSISMDRDLFKKVEAVHSKKDSLELLPEEKTTLENKYKAFIRSGVHLEGDEKEEFEKIEERLTEFSNNFDENLKKEAKDYFLKIEEKDLEGLLEDAVSFCKNQAEKKFKEKKKELESSIKEEYAIVLLEDYAKVPNQIMSELDEKITKVKDEIGEYIIVINRRFILSDILPYLKSRPSREKIWKAVSSICISGKNSNRENVRNISNERLKKAKLLGFETYADFALDNRMAKNRQNVYNLMNELKEKALPAAREDAKEVEEYAKALEGRDFILMPWDVGYYSRLLEEEKYSLSEEELKQYFTLENVRKATFNLTSKFYGLSFEKRDDIQTWHPDVEVYQVADKAGKNSRFLGLIYTDLFMRPGEKYSGAWMNGFVDQEDNSFKVQRPHIQLCMNLKKTNPEEAVLMTRDEVMTFLHEFGHCLHGLFSQVKYTQNSGTSVYRDFVELPSQVMENFFYKKELFLDVATKHHKTGESLPEELYQKMLRADKFQAGRKCIVQLSYGLQDLAFHTITEPFAEDADIVVFEKSVTEDMELWRKVEDFASGMACNFSHIFSGGYAAGYYSYKWAEVLDADAFEFMKQNDFSEEVMTSFRKNILEKGGSEDPEILYKRFRGQIPTPDALLRRDGLI
jgi:peptidyl-dipeptidase Dcp